MVLPDGRTIRRKESNNAVGVITGDIPETEIDWADDIRVVSPRAAIVQCMQTGTDPSLIDQAIANAKERHMLNEVVAARLLTANHDPHKTRAMLLALIPKP